MKILSTGDNPLISTGYGTVWNNLLSRWCALKPDWEFYHIGWQNQDREHKTVEGYTMLPMGKLEYGYDAVAAQLDKLKPDFLVTLADVGWQSGYAKIVADAKQRGWRGKWVAYTPIDTHGWAMTWDEVFAMPDLNIAMAGFGEKQMMEHKVPNVHLIPHGVDTVCFKPLANREEIREKFKLKGKYVVGFVGRNQRRKMIDRQLTTFANFSKGKDDVVMLMHTDQEPPKDGWSLPYMITQMKVIDKDIESKVKLTKSNMDIPSRQKIAPDNMNEIFNMMDTFLYCTGGEGFGLPGIECQAAGVPLIMNDNSTACDLCKEKNRIPRLKDNHGRDMKDVGTNGVYFMYPDDIAGAEILEKHYASWKENKYAEEGADARRLALSYDWGPISLQWIKLFEEEAV